MPFWYKDYFKATADTGEPRKPVEVTFVGDIYIYKRTL